jgi:phosphatidylinositol 4-kinase
MVELLGGDLNAEPFRLFMDLTVQGFLTARMVMEPLVTVVASMADSGLPCFLHKNDNLVQFRNRFVPNMTSSGAAQYMRELIIDAASKWTTVCYDGIQKLQNNIYSDKWK